MYNFVHLSEIISLRKVRTGFSWVDGRGSRDFYYIKTGPVLVQHSFPLLAKLNELQLCTIVSFHLQTNRMKVDPADHLK